MPEIEVMLSELVGTTDSPIGPVPTVVEGVWRCDAFHESLPNGMLHIGMIGRQDGANFCANNSFGEFTPEQQAMMVEQIKAQHGNASVSAPVELPEAIPPEDLYEDDGDEDELEDTEIE